MSEVSTPSGYSNLNIKLIFELKSNENNSYTIIFTGNISGEITIEAEKKDDLFHIKFSNKFTIEKIKEHKYFSKFIDLKEIFNAIKEIYDNNNSKLKLIENKNDLLFSILPENDNELCYNLKEVKNIYHEKISKITNLISNLTNENEKFKKQLNEIQNKNNELDIVKIEMNEIKNNLSQAIKEINNHNNEIKEIKDNHKKEINEIKINQAKEIEEIKKKFNQELNLIKNNHINDINQIKNNLNEIINKHNMDINLIKNNYSNEINEIKNSLNVFKNDFNTHINNCNMQNNAISNNCNQEISQLSNNLTNKINQINNYFNNEIFGINNRMNIIQDNDIKELKKQMIALNDYINNKDLKNSLIIGNNNNYFNSLKSWINPNRSIRSRLLYKLSRDGDQISRFHELCDNKGPTLTLFIVQDGNIGGLFTPLSWDCNSGWKGDMNTFMFNLNQNRVFKKIKNECSIYCDIRNGPFTYMFGFFQNHQMRKIQSGGISISQYFDHGSEILPNNNQNIQYYNVREVEVYQIKIE